jgi:acetylxylan esterase
MRQAFRGAHVMEQGMKRMQRGIWVALLALFAAGGAIAAWRWLEKPAGQLVAIPEFGDNPTGLAMHLYVPPRLAARPAVLLALHWCQGSGPDFHASTRYARLADRHGFIVIYPSATRASRCWDVHSTAALTHGGGSDPQGLLSMLDYVMQHHHADRGRVFVTGHSSGGMMTQLLLGAYPDVFRAGAAQAGVPFGCFAGAEEWHEACARGQVMKSPQEWGELVRQAYPGFAGTRPAVQLWHGTADDGLSFHNFGESIKQWSNVLGTATLPTATVQGVPRRSWTREQYMDARGEVQLEAYRGAGEPHNFRMSEETVLGFFGLDR